MQFTTDQGTEIECDEALGRALGFTVVGDSKPASNPDNAEGSQDTSDNGQGHPEPSGPVGEVPDGSMQEVLEWVGSDPERAQAATEAEKARPKQRKSLLNDLAEIK